MRHKLLLLCLVFLSSCQNNSPYIEIEEDYNSIDYPPSFIEWNDLFNKDSDDYYIYVFSYDCYYCNQLKRKMICFYDQSRFPVYFCEYKKDSPINHNTEITVGESDINNVFIRGTPTLIYVKEKKIAFNVAGKAEVSEMINLHLKNE